VGTNRWLHLWVCVCGLCGLVLSGVGAVAGTTVTFVFPSDYATCGATEARVYGGANCTSPGLFLSQYGVYPPSGTVEISSSLVGARITSGAGGDCVVMSLTEGGSSTVYLTMNGCAANGPPTITNFVHCVNWTNTTGSAKGVRILDSTGNVVAIGYFVPGASLNRCFTNQNALEYSVGYPPYQGADEDDWLYDFDTDTVTSFTTSGSGVTGSGPDNSTSQASVTNGVTYQPGTNLVVYYSPTTNGSSAGASQADIRQLGDALIKALGPPLTDIARNTWLQYQNSLTNGSGGSGLSSDAGITNAVAVNRDAVTNAVQRLQDKLDTNLTAVARAGTNGLGTNTFGDMTAVVGEGGSGFGTHYGSGFSTISNEAALTVTNSMTGSATPLLFNFQHEDAPLAALSVLDLRPSSWSGAMTTLATCIRVLLALGFLAGLYWAIYTDFMNGTQYLNLVASNVGKALSGASVGALVSYPVKLVVANVVTVGLAGLPALFLATVSSLGLDSVSEVSPIALAQSTAAGISSTTATAMSGGWHLILQAFPWVVCTGCIVNYFAWRIAYLYFQQLWLIIFRLLPLLMLSTTLHADQWIIENRLHVPVGCLVNGETHWFPMGETRCELASSFTATHGGATNVGSVSSSGSEWTRVIIWESSTNTVAVSTYGQDGFRTTFSRGFVTGLSIVLFVMVIVIVKRSLRMGTYGGGE